MREAGVPGAGLALLHAQDAEDRANRNVHVDVAGAIQRIGDDQVPTRCVGKDDRVLELFARDSGAVSAASQDGEQGFVRDDVELLDALTLNVRLPGPTEDVGETRASHAPGDQLGGQADLVEERREHARRAGHLEHALQNERLERGASARRIRGAPGSFGHRCPSLVDD